MKMRNIKILASILFLLISSVCLAQVGSGTMPPPNDAMRPPPPPGLPIDGGVFVFLAFGLLYGAQRILKSK